MNLIPEVAERLGVKPYELFKTNPTEGEVVQESMANITDFARLISECSMGYDNRESEAKRRAKANRIRKCAERILNLIGGVEKALDGDIDGKGKKK